jgi:hypothetical protein
MTFSRWLKNQAGRDDPVGDLARDALRDKDFPKGASLKGVLRHLLLHNACDGALRALDRAYKEFST